MALGYTDFPGVKQDGSDTPQQRANVTNQHNLGKINAGDEITFRASQTTTTVDDPRIYATSNLILTPLTANARTALATSHISNREKGSATFTHASNVAADQTFVMTILH